MPQENLDLQQTLKRALDYSPEIKKAQSQLTQAEDTYDKAKAAIYPTITATSTALGRQNAIGTTSAATGTANVTTTTVSSNGQGNFSNIYNAAVSLTQPIYAGGAIDAGKGLYSTDQTISRHSLFSTRQTQVSNTVATFYTLAQAQQLADAATQNRDLLKEYLKVTTYYENIGRSRKMDKLQADANYSLSLVDFEQHQNLLKMAQNNLKKLLGEDTTQMAIKANFIPQAVKYDLPSKESAYLKAQQKNPGLKVSQLDVDLVQFTRDLDLAIDRPSLSLVASAGYQSTDPSMWFTPNALYYSGGLSLAIPIFSGFSSFDKRNIYKEQKYQAERDLQTTEDTLKNQIEDGLSNAQSTRDQYELMQTSVRQARQALDMAVKGYKTGVASSTDVTNLQSTKYNAEKLFVTSIYTYLTAILNLELLMGNDLESRYIHY